MPRAVRAVRGATTTEADTVEQIDERVQEMVRALLDRNGLGPDDVISMLLTATPDLRSTFPATAARKLGLENVPLMSAQEIDVEGGLARCVRVLAHVETDRPRAELRHVFLHGARALRPDLAE